MPDLLDTPINSPDTDMEILSSRAIPRQYSRDATTSTVSIQGSGNHYHACASDDYEDVGFDPSILPPPDPWIDSVTDDQLDVSFNSSAILEVCGRIFSDTIWLTLVLHYIYSCAHKFCLFSRSGVGNLSDNECI